MSELLIELFSEEIPARMQAKAAEDLARLVAARLGEAGLKADSLEGFAGPRRLGLVARGLPERAEDVREERKGPRVDAPTQAIEGFLRGAGLTSIDQCRVEETKKGSVYIAVIEKPGRATTEVIGEALPEIVRSFPWPKSMKFGEGAHMQRWVRPLHRIICLLDGRVVPVEVFGLTASNQTEGHRIHSVGDRVLTVSGYEDYAAQLAANGVVLRREDRERQVLEGARKVCAEAGLELVEDEGLLAEVAGLVERPVAVLGEMDPAFLDLPPEVITLTMKVHQKYFAVRDPKTGQLAPKFVMLANQQAPDGGKAIAAGAARVLSARLSDARHFWDIDRKRGLEAMAKDLGKVTFHEKLGTVADKVERVAALARELAPAVGADPELAELAARLCKADLVSQMVYEFPELQGVMGRYYALASDPSTRATRAPQDEGGGLHNSPHPEASAQPASKGEGGLSKLSEDERSAVADAIRDHYKPQGPSDFAPTAPVSAAVALADKLDTLVGFWAIDEKPTGSKDPFALRRAALGVIAILQRGQFRMELWVPIVNARARIPGLAPEAGEPTVEKAVEAAASRLFGDLLSFFADRLKFHLKDEGIRHDVIDAVFALGDDDLVRVTNKSRALQVFIDTDDGTALLAGYRRAANILKAEEKKGFDPGAALAAAGGADTLLATVSGTAQADEERALIAAIREAEGLAGKALAAEDFDGAMTALAALRAPVDAFFEAVVVNAEDDMLRRNRLLLLSRIRAAVRTVADFDRLEG